jgi:ABC-type lipoprotein release transport system permease subunit
MVDQMVASATERTTGHIQLHRRAFIDDRDLYATLPDDWPATLEAQVDGIHVAPRLYAAGLASSQQTSYGVMIEAVDPARERRATSMLDHLRAGTGAIDRMSSDERPRHQVLLGAQLAKNMQLIPGNELVLVTQAADGSIGNDLYRVAGILKPLSPDFDRMGVLMSLAAYRDLMYLDRGVHEFAVRLDQPDELTETQQRIQQVVDRQIAAHPLDELGGPAVVRNWRELNPAVADMLALSETMLLIIGLIVISLAAMGVLNTMLMALHERSHEFGILLAIGMKRRWLLAMVLCESFFLSLVAAAVGVAGGLGVIAWLGEDGIDFSAALPDGYDWAGMVFDPVIPLHLVAGHVVEAVGLMIVITLIASLIPSWRITRLKPAEVM